MNWMDTYIRLCLARVPHSGFRRRAAAELADHLELLAADLKAGGLSPQQARAAALERMGDPQVLARNYEAVWQHRARSPRYSSPRIGLGCILTGLVYLLTLTALGALGVTYDASPGMPMIGNSFLSALVGCALFLIPFSSGGILLFHLLRGCPHLGRLITAGLLLAWAGEKAAVLSLSSSVGIGRSVCPDQRDRRPHRPLVYSRLYPAHTGGLSAPMCPGSLCGARPPRRFSI